MSLDAGQDINSEFGFVPSAVHSSPTSFYGTIVDTE